MDPEDQFHLRVFSVSPCRLDGSVFVSSETYVKAVMNRDAYLADSAVDGSHVLLFSVITSKTTR